MRRLLEIAERVCGVHARHRIFEPLVADWQYELRQARRNGRVAYLGVLVSGTLVFLRSTLSSAVVGSWVPPLRTATLGMATLMMAVALPLSAPIIWRALSGMPPEIASIRTLSSMARYANLYFPVAAMLAMFMMRRDPRLSRRHASLTVIAIAIAGTGLASAGSNDALRRYFTTPEWFEREYQRAVANDRAGRLQYPGTAVRQIRVSSYEQRRAGYERFVAMTRSQPPDAASWQGSAQQFQPVALAVVLAVMGWRLATLARPTLLRGTLWWLLMFGVTTATMRWPPGATLVLVCALTALLHVNLHPTRSRT